MLLRKLKARITWMKYGGRRTAPRKPETLHLTGERELQHAGTQRLYLRFLILNLTKTLKVHTHTHTHTHTHRVKCKSTMISDWKCVKQVK